MAIVSLVALLVALAVVALVSVQPWQPSVVAPQLGVAPDLGAGLDDAVAVPAAGPAVAQARPAAAGRRFAATGPVAREQVSGPRPRVAPARAVTPPAGGGLPAATAEPEPAPAPPTAPQPPPEPVAMPVAVPVAEPAPSPSPEPASNAPVRVAGGAGGDPGPSTAGAGPVVEAEEPVEILAGEDYAFAFSFLTLPTAYLAPGSENLLVRFKGAESDTPTFGLQLWDDGGEDGPGLWSSGEAMDGERFLAPTVPGVWHEVALYFHASGEDDGFYVLLLDGEPIDARGWIGLIDSGESSTWLELGVFRDGERIVGVSAGTIFGSSSL